MTLKEARAFMLSNPGAKIACRYFHDEWIMFDGRRFVFDEMPDIPNPAVGKRKRL